MVVLVRFVPPDNVAMVILDRSVPPDNVAMAILGRSVPRNLVSRKAKKLLTIVSDFFKLVVPAFFLTGHLPKG